MRCPACTDAILGKEGNCRRCKGQWLERDAMATHPELSFDVTGGNYGERRCPRCDEEMDEPLICGIPIDRCAAHGMWFDKAELDELRTRSRAGAWQQAPEPKPEDSLRVLVDVMRAWRAG